MALHRHPWSQVRPGVQRLAVSLLSKKGSGGYTAGGVPVPGTLPELGPSRTAGLRPPKWHFTGTRGAKSGQECRVREICISWSLAPPRRRPSVRKPKRPRRAPPSSLDETALGGLGRSQRCAGRVAASDSHYKRQFTRAARGQQRPPRSRQRRRLRVHPLWPP